MSKPAPKPPIEVIVGPAHSAKTAHVIGAFRDSLGHGEEPVLILPTAQAVASLRTDLLLDKTFDFLGGPRILTFIQFAEQVLRRHAPEVGPIDAMVQDELLVRIIEGLAGEGKISYHAGVLNFRGFVRAVRAFIMELKRAEITPGQFERFASRKDAGRKDRELSAVYSRYQDTLQRLDLYDEEGRFWRAKLLVSDGRLGPFASMRRLFLDGFYDFTPTQLGLIEVLGCRGVALAMSLPLEDDSARAELFETATATLDALARRFVPSLKVLPGKDVREPALGWLADNLFRTSPPEGAPPPDSIRLIETPGAVVEVREIAREIKRLHLDYGIALDKIAVVFRTLGDYRDVVDEVFEEFGIPARIASGVRLSLTPVAQLMLHVLRVPADDWRSRDVLDLLRSNYVSPSCILGDGLSASRFEELATEAGVIRGRSSWTRSLKALRERVAVSLESAGEDLDDEVRIRAVPEELKGKLRELELATETCGKLFALFEPLENANTVHGLVRALADVMASLGVEENVRRAPALNSAFRDIESLNAVRECLDGLVRAAAVVGRTKSSLRDFAGNLALACADTTVSGRGPDFGRVHVSEVHDVRALAFDMVFIGGLLERSFPRMHREGPFYDDSQRETPAWKGLDPAPRRLAQREERFLFYLAATRPRKRLYLSYPVTDIEGKEKLVSYYVGEVKRIFAPREIECRRLSPGTKLVGADAAGSRAELRRAAVMDLAAPRLVRPALLARVSAYLWRDDPRSALVLKRGLEGEAERDSWDPFGAHDGVLSHPLALAELAERFGAKHDFSITALEEFGCCPFAFFCRSVLRVEPPSEPPEEIEPVDEGALLHRTLREFYAERRRDRTDTRIGEDEIQEATKRICEIADAALERFRRRNPDMNQGLFRLECEMIRDRLSKFVVAEVERAKSDDLGMVPRFFEAAFGLPVNPQTADPISSPRRLVLQVKGRAPVSLVGKIDRIDVAEPSAQGPARPFRVIDYKRSDPTSGTGGIEDGTALQMPVYIMAASDVLLAGRGMEAVQAQFYGLKEMKAVTAMNRLKPSSRGLAWDDCLKAARRFIRRHVRDIRDGIFPVVRRGDGMCQGFCEFREICRYSEWRAVKKLGRFKPWFDLDGARTDDDE